jgi:hypothetical protein
MTEEQFDEFKKDINEKGIDDVLCIAVIRNGVTNLDVIKELFIDDEINIEDVLTVNAEWANSYFKWITAPPIYSPRQLEKITNKKIEMTREQWEEWKKYGC